MRRLVSLLVVNATYVGLL